MSELFDRFARVTVIDTVIDDSNPAALKIVSVSESATQFSSVMDDGSPGFRIKFSVDKITEATPNPTSIYLYNLAPSSRALFEKRNNFVILEAGYVKHSEVIYRGQILRARTRKEGPDYITQIECADGLFQYQHANVDVSFREGASKNQAFKTLTDSFAAAGLGVGEVKGLPTDGYNQGVVLSGRSTDILTELCESEGLKWTISDDQILIVPVGKALDEPAVVIAPDTGMIGVPEIGESGRITVKTLLNAKLKPFINVVVQSKFLMDFKNGASVATINPGNPDKPLIGFYTAVKITHTGDTFGGDFYSIVEAV